jgi:hypothetical protein
MTKQLNSVTVRPVPAPAVIRPGGQVLEVLERAVEPLLPDRRLRLDLGQRAGDPPPGVLDRAVDGRAVRLLEAVLHVPDLLGDGGGEAGHGDSLGRREDAKIPRSGRFSTIP